MFILHSLRCRDIREWIYKHKRNKEISKYYIIVRNFRCFFIVNSQKLHFLNSLNNIWDLWRFPKYNVSNLFSKKRGAAWHYNDKRTVQCFLWYHNYNSKCFFSDCNRNFYISICFLWSLIVRDASPSRVLSFIKSSWRE